MYPIWTAARGVPFRRMPFPYDADPFMLFICNCTETSCPSPNVGDQIPLVTSDCRAVQRSIHSSGVIPAAHRTWDPQAEHFLAKPYRPALRLGYEEVDSFPAILPAIKDPHGFPCFHETEAVRHTPLIHHHVYQGFLSNSG